MLAHLLVAALATSGSLLADAHETNLGANALQTQERDIVGRQSTANSHGSWLGWGANIFNNRWASSDAKIDSSNVAFLQSVCKQEYAVGESAPPLVVDGIAYYPTWDGLLVALDYTRCEVLWQTNVSELVYRFGPLSNTTSAVNRPRSRTTPALYKNFLFIGTSANALLLAIDKRNGKLVDTIQISNHPLAMLTMSPTVYQGRIFMGTSSNEELGADVIPGYVCCSFIGTMNGISFEYGRFKLEWSQPMIPAGSNFSGAAIWGSQPSIDTKRNQVFIATGNVYSVPPSYDACVNTTSTNTNNATDPCAPQNLYQEAVLALNLITGDINWSHQLSPLDAWNAACIQGIPGGGVNPGACPGSPGPDADFGIAPTFVPGSKETPHGVDTLVIGQKNGNLYGLSASDGTLFWALATSPDGTQGGLIWGIAVDATAAYYTAANSLRKPWKLQNGTALTNSAFGAASLRDGKILWETPVPRNSSSYVQPTVVNDVVLVGDSGPGAGLLSAGFAGSFIALDKYTGGILVDRVLDQYFQSGIAAVRDYVMFGTGYGTTQTPNGSFNVWQLLK